MTEGVGQNPDAVKNFLDREQVAKAMTEYVTYVMPDEEILPENVVEVPVGASEVFANCKVWCACCGPFVVIATNFADMEELGIEMHS